MPLFLAMLQYERMFAQRTTVTCIPFFIFVVDRSNFFRVGKNFIVYLNSPFHGLFLLVKSPHGKHSTCIVSLTLLHEFLCSIKAQSLSDELGKPFSFRRCRAWFDHYAGMRS